MLLLFSFEPFKYRDTNRPYYTQSSFSPTQIFEEGTTEEKGENARLNAFVGAIAVGDLVKSTLGPKGMDKILQSAYVFLFTQSSYIPSLSPPVLFIPPPYIIAQLLTPYLLGLPVRLWSQMTEQPS